MASCDQGWTQARELLDGSMSAWPIVRGGPGRRAHLMALEDRAPEAIEVHRGQRVTCEKRAVAAAEEGDVAGRVTGGLDHLPIGKTGYGLRWVQGLNVLFEVGGASGEEAREAGEESGAGEIHRRIFSGAGEVWEFAWVGVDADAPFGCQCPGRSGMVEMAMREQNGAGAAAASETVLGGASNAAVVSGRAGID